MALLPRFQRLLVGTFKQRVGGRGEGAPFDCGTKSTTSLTVANMADKTPKESGARVASRIDPMTEDLSREQKHFIRHVELQQWKKKTEKLRVRNVVTGLAIGALVAGIYGYTFFSVSQEGIMAEMDEEAKRARLQEPKSGAN